MDLPNIKNISTGKIIVDNSNPNIMSDKAFASLKRNIERYGFLIPVITNKDFKIADGFHRWKAARELGLTEVPVIALDIDEVDRRMLRQILNKLRGEHDGHMDAVEYQYILEQGQGELFEQLSTIGIDEINQCINEVNPVDVQEDEFVPDLEKPPRYIVNKGDVYILGSHRLMCGDSTVKADVDKLMDGDKADMVFTDPPYNVSIGTIKHPKFKQREIQNDSMSADEFNVFCKGWVNNISFFCDGIIYCWGGQGEDGRLMFSILDNVFHNSTTIIWVKDQFTLGRGKYHCQYEPCWFGWNKSGITFTDDRTLVNVWDFKRPQKSDLHPTMKPIDLCANALKHNPKSKSVLDLFGGSGSTLIACEQLNRKCYMMELDEKYVSTIIERFIKLKGSSEEVFKLNEDGSKTEVSVNG